MNANTKPSDIAAVVAVIDPDAYTHNGGTGSDGVYLSTYVDMSKFNSLQAIIMAGTLASTATLNGKLVQSKTATNSDSSKKDVSGKAITALTQAGTDSDKQAIINLFAEELDTANGFRYVALEMTVGTAGADAGAILIGHSARYEPASDNDISTVDEIV